MKNQFNRQTLNQSAQNSFNEGNSILEETKEKDYFVAVNRRYKNVLGHQVSKSTEIRRQVLIQAIEHIKRITLIQYQRELWEKIIEMLSNLRFVKDCLGLELNPFFAALNIIIAGKQEMNSVLKKGIIEGCKDPDSLIHGLFSEEELARAKYSWQSRQPSDKQLKEASDLILAMRQVLELVNKSE